MKTKYQRMSKPEKKELLQKYRETEAGQGMMKRLTRLQILGIAGILYILCLLVSSIKSLTVYDFCIMIPLFFISIFLIVMSIHLKNKVLNQFAIKMK